MNWKISSWKFKHQATKFEEHKKATNEGYLKTFELSERLITNLFLIYILKIVKNEIVLFY